MELWLGLLVVFTCISIAGFSSGAEIGFLSINKVRLKHLVEKGNHRAIIATKIVDDLPRFLIGMLMGINIAIITASCITTALFERWAVWVEIGLTIIIVLFAEIIPKTIFRHHSTRLVLTLVYIIRAWYYLLIPIINLIAMVIGPVIGKKKKGPLLTREDFLFLMEEGEEHGAIEEETEEMIGDVLELSETRIREVMTPRIDMICLPAEANMNEILTVFSQHHYSRIPVYDETIDNIIGILYIKDLLNFWGKADVWISAVELIRFPYFIPATKRVDDLLEEFQAKKIQIAIVVDEYGGIDGLVTLEDVLEEIVGEIHDEYETIDSPIKQKDKDTFLIDGYAGIEMINETVGLNIPEGDFETISGFIMERLGKIPLIGEVITYKNLNITIIEATEKTIERVEVEVNKC
ncbi:HlyC/CorC family transporter [Candidatus Desantisbacteria bacterium]|nr:HlyC/CorC family transporter [Candidatus Desantisbacteria bacterium]